MHTPTYNVKQYLYNLIRSIVSVIANRRLMPPLCYFILLYSPMLTAGPGVTGWEEVMNPDGDPDPEGGLLGGLLMIPVALFFLFILASPALLLEKLFPSWSEEERTLAMWISVFTVSAVLGSFFSGEWLLGFGLLFAAAFVLMIKIGNDAKESRDLSVYHSPPQKESNAASARKQPSAINSNRKRVSTENPAQQKRSSIARTPKQADTRNSNRKEVSNENLARQKQSNRPLIPPVSYQCPNCHEVNDVEDRYLRTCPMCKHSSYKG